MRGKVWELRGIIFSKYDSESQLASELGWPRQRLNKITNGAKEPDVSELNSLAKALDRSVDDLVQIFLRHKSPNEQHSA